MVAPTTVPLIRLWPAVLAGYLALGATVQEMPEFVMRRFGGGAGLLPAGRCGPSQRS